MSQRPTALRATDAQTAPSSTPPDQPQSLTPQMHDDDPPAASVAAHAPSSSARSASAVGAAASSASSASSASASISAPAVAVASASAGSKRKSRAADNAPTAEAAVAGSSSASASSLQQSTEEDQPTAASSQPAAASAALSVAAPNSAAASLSSASNAHLASVLESPSAAAPVAKRTRRAAQSAQATAAQARSSPMIRLLGADSGARQSLLEMMDLSSIAQLQCTGRSWRGWIADAPFFGSRELVIKGAPKRNPSRCQWLRRSVHHLHFDDHEFSDDGDDPILAFDQLMLLQWSRLRSITAAFDRPLASVELLHAGFGCVAATLQRLCVSLQWHPPLAAANLLTAISSLHQLESLTVDAAADCTSLSLSPLAALPRLQQFALREDVSHSCSLAQVDALAQCTALTDLDCGEWLPIYNCYRPFVQITDAQLQQSNDILGRLFRLRKENGAAPLRRLKLGPGSMILPQCWRVLARFTALEELDAHWSCTLTAADWMLLANFPRLHTLTITALEYEGSRALLDLSVVYPGLVACRTLRTLDLNGIVDLRTEHVAVLAQIPSLESFKASYLRIESLEPLSNAPALTELYLSGCAGLNGESINIRAMIPPMPVLTKLTVYDDFHRRLPAAQAEPLNVALLARLPKLTPARFIQN